MNLRMGACLVVLGILGGIAAAQGGPAEKELEQALVAQETKLIEAINRKDKAAISALLADEVMSITGRGRQTTQQIIKTLERISFTNYRLDDPQAFSVSPDVAILTCKFSWTGASSSQSPATTSVYSTSVWRKREGEWRCVFYQESPIAK